MTRKLRTVCNQPDFQQDRRLMLKRLALASGALLAEQTSAPTMLAGNASGH